MSLNDVFSSISDPTGLYEPVSIVSRSFPCVSNGRSPTSSRNSVVPFALPSRPFLLSPADVYAPFLCPNRSESII